MKGSDKGLSNEEKSVRLNVMRGMAGKIRTQSKTFRNMQRDFLLKLKKRDETGNEFFSGTEEERLSGMTLDELLENGLSQEQLQQMDNIRGESAAREQEIIRIAQSINELATMFRELSILIVEQGSILDRIDYNIEQSKVSVSKGKQEVELANKYSESSSKRSLICIGILLVGIIVCITILALRFRNK